MKIPNAGKAFVDIHKLRDYTLNPEHLRGQHKARVFLTALGFSTDDAETLQNALLLAVRDHEAIEGVRDEYGQR